MKKKNEIEQELDKKEFEKELRRDLDSKYNRVKVEELFYQGKNKYVIGAIHFFSTLIFFEAFYWVVTAFINAFTLGYSQPIFATLSPFVHAGIFILSVSSVVKKKSAVEVVVDRWPF